MKTTAFAAIAVASASAISADFTSGFMKSVMVKDQAAIDQFECPAPVIAEDFKNMMNMAKPMMAMMKNMNAGKDGADSQGDMIEKVIMAGTEYAHITAIFQNYEGGDFCQGLLAAKEAQSIFYKVMDKFMNDKDGVSTDAMFQ